jgi:RNA polymerase sigma-70 factor, ECF subfamily
VLRRFLPDVPHSHTKTSPSRVYNTEEMSDAADETRAAWVVRLYEAHGPRLYRYATMILADRHDAEDVVQQVFSAVLTARTRPDDAERYLRSAVRNASFSLLRRRKTARAAAEQLLVPVAREASAEERAGLERALRLLPADQREVVHLHVYEGLTFREVAEVTGDSINTIAARYRYALVHLRKTLT